MTKDVVIPGRGRVSFGMKITFSRYGGSVGIVLHGKRGARLGYISVDYAELQEKIAGLPEDVYAKMEEE